MPSTERHCRGVWKSNRPSCLQALRYMSWHKFRFISTSELLVKTKQNRVVVGMDSEVRFVGNYVNCVQLTVLLYNNGGRLRAGGPGDRRSIPGRSERIFCSSLCVQTGSGAHPASCTMGTGGPFPGGKASDAYHSSVSRAEAEN
jgi:hypothetical protein